MQSGSKVWVVLGAAMVAGGCEPKELNDIPPTPVVDRCVTFGQGATLSQSGVVTKRVSPGDKTILSPIIRQGPAIVNGLPECVRDLVVIPGDGASEDDFTLTRLEDGRYEFTISPSATPGGSFRFSAKYGQEMDVGDVIYVYDAERWPLEGVWSQSRETCNRAAIGELEFGRGRYSVTWQPFESYKDYWGDYTFVWTDRDSGLGELTIDVQRGNMMALAEGKHTLNLRIEGDTMTISEGRFAIPGNGLDCDAPFTRRR